MWNQVRDYIRQTVKAWWGAFGFATAVVGIVAQFGVPVILPAWAWELIAFACFSIAQFRVWRASVAREQTTAARLQAATSPHLNSTGTLSMLHAPGEGSSRRILYIQTTGKRRVETTGGRPRLVRFIKPLSGSFINAGDLPARIPYPVGEITVWAFMVDGVEVEDSGGLGQEIIVEVFLEPTQPN